MTRAYRSALLSAVLSVLLVGQVCCSPRTELGQLNRNAPTQPSAITSGHGVVIDIESKSQFRDIIDAGGICFVTLYSSECGPCHFMDPIMSALAARYADSVTVCKLDGDRFYSVVKQYQTKGYPTVLIISNGRETERFLGPRPESIYISALDKLTKEHK